MCYYNGIKVSKDEYIRLKSLERKIAVLTEDLVIHKGFDYGDHPIRIPKANSKETETVQMQWGFLPSYIDTTEKIKKWRYGYKDERGYHKPYITLDARSEEMLDKIYADAALNRRCLIPSTGFVEWMHVQVVGKSGKLLKTPEKFPYYIQLRNEEEFYIAGVWNPVYVKDLGITINTWAMLTTEGNSLMKQIHNSKERQPTILPGHLAEAWLYKDLAEQEIVDIGNYQTATSDMKARPLHKDFLTRENPLEEVTYNEPPKLLYA